MRSRLGSLIVLWSLGAACSDEQLGKDIARAKLTPLPEGAQIATENPVGLELGDVPLNGAEIATFEVENVGPARLVISGATVEDATGGTFTVVEVPSQLSITEKGLLRVRFAPAADAVVGSAVIALATNGGPDENEVVRAQVSGKGLFIGSPNIQVCYGGQCYPRPEHCADRGDGLSQCDLPPLDFGNVPFSQTSAQEIRLRNLPAAGTCQVPPGDPVCTEVCRLSIDRNPIGRDIGLGFVPEGLGYSVAGNLAFPFELDPSKPECDRTGEQRFLIRFAAGSLEETISATLAIETNDPDAPFIDIPVTATVREAPIAVAEIRACDVDDPPPDCSIPDEIRPLDRAFLDGRRSYEPSRPTDPTAISEYEWVVLDYPQGANPDDFDLQGADTATPSLWLPIAGEYTLRLRVVNDEGIESGVSDTSDVVIKAVPAERLHIELTWDQPNNDMDLHLTRVFDGHRLCRGADDCFWRNCRPSCVAPDCTPAVWYPSPAFTGPNPRLDIDDTSGLGPENINIDEPVPNRYRIYVHYYGLINPDEPPTNNTVRVYLDGIIEAELRRRLESNDIWAVADIVWEPESSSVVLLDSDGAGVGQVRNLTSCPAEGVDFRSLNN